MNQDERIGLLNKYVHYADEEQQCWKRQVLLLLPAVVTQWGWEWVHYIKSRRDEGSRDFRRC